MKHFNDIVQNHLSVPKKNVKNMKKYCKNLPKSKKKNTYLFQVLGQDEYESFYLYNANKYYTLLCHSVNIGVYMRNVYKIKKLKK